MLQRACEDPFVKRDIVGRQCTVGFKADPVPLVFKITSVLHMYFGTCLSPLPLLYTTFAAQEPPPESAAAPSKSPPCHISAQTHLKSVALVHCDNEEFEL